MFRLQRNGPLCAALSSVMFASALPAYAQVAGPDSAPVQEQLDALRQQVIEQQKALDTLRSELGEQDARYKQLLQSIEERQRGQAQADTKPPGQPAPVAGEGPREVQIGTAPAETQAPVAQLFDQPGVLTPKGKIVLEPSVQYGYSSSNRVALVGFTIVPAILIGLIDVREVRRNTLTAALAMRYGLSDRSEVEVRVPYVHRSDSVVSREIFQSAVTDSVFQTSGTHIGDAEITGRWQLTEGTGRLPYLIGSLRFKSRTGRDPFEVVTNCSTRCIDPNVTGNGEPLDLPTSSGFYTLQPGITWLLPSDPAVFFGSFTYAYNFKRSNVSRRVLGDQSEFLGEVKAGNAIGFNLGMGLALNERSSFSIGVEVASIGRTKQNGVAVPGSVRTQLASLALGYSHVWDAQRTINFAVSAGLTRDTPDLTLTLRIPFTL